MDFRFYKWNVKTLFFPDLKVNISPLDHPTYDCSAVSAFSMIHFNGQNVRQHLRSGELLKREDNNVSNVLERL